jgi:osmotically inducible protein OsmC
MKRKASAVWNGTLKGGKGTMSTETKALTNVPYSFTTRFETEPGTNPEELVAAALAGCFSMALAADLEGAGMNPQSVQTTATLNFEKLEQGWTTTEIHLDVTARVPGADKAKVEQIANGTKGACPISRLLNTKITVTTTLQA